MIDARRFSQRAALRIARVLAVQAVYQAAVAQTALNDVVDEFMHHRMSVLGESVSPVSPVSPGGSAGKNFLPAPEYDFFYHLMTGLEDHFSNIDEMIRAHLSDDRPIERQLPLLVAILRCGVAEFLVCPQTPVPVIIDEYIDIAQGFFSEREPTFVNAALDHLARVARPVQDDASCPG